MILLIFPDPSSRSWIQPMVRKPQFVNTRSSSTLEQLSPLALAFGDNHHHNLQTSWIARTLFSSQEITACLTTQTKTRFWNHEISDSSVQKASSIALFCAGLWWVLTTILHCYLFSDLDPKTLRPCVCCFTLLIFCHLSFLECLARFFWL